ncbi:MarR family winged helix-turn-helix transcriptional regulator [Microbacterium sp.]|uniref:MarR family winged helix-turn-helix transcriptional regulator n=1 Tax=Microbacterium sp. TaxID=51671 RepID=UPI003C78042F
MAVDAVRAWESLFRAQASIARELLREGTWNEVSAREYGVLYELTRWPGGARFTDLQADELLTQPGLSRLVGRLEQRGLVARTDDAQDRRAARLRLTDEGRSVQRRLGAQHARDVAALMMLDHEKLDQLRSLCDELVAHIPTAAHNDTTEETR